MHLYFQEKLMARWWELMLIKYKYIMKENECTLYEVSGAIVYFAPLLGPHPNAACSPPPGTQQEH